VHFGGKPKNAGDDTEEKNMGSLRAFGFMDAQTPNFVIGAPLAYLLEKPFQVT
jgi:hypothetical protein